MGGLVGGIWAAGKLEEFSDWALGLTRGEVLRMLDPSPRAPGAMRAERVLARVHELVGDEQIENLAVPFTAVATDLLSRKEVWLQRGPVGTAIRASIALPGIFTPVMLNGRLLADGGLMNPVPVTPLAALDADLTIAVSAGGEREPSALSRGRKERPLSQDDHSGDEPQMFPAGLTGFDVMSYSLGTMQSVVSRYRLAGSPPDLLLAIPETDVRTMEFHRAEEMIALGRSAAAQALEKIA